MMSKRLTLVRHAKSSWKFDTDDFYRPLNRRGIADATHMAKGEIASPPDLILCSPAVRTYATAIAYMREQHWPDDRLSLVPVLYECSWQTLLQAISQIDSQTDLVVNSLWVVGHNPGLQGMAEYLLKKEIDNIVTSARLEFALPVNQWSELAVTEAPARLINYCVPVHISDIPAGHE